MCTWRIGPHPPLFLVSVHSAWLAKASRASAHYELRDSEHRQECLCYQAGRESLVPPRIRCFAEQCRSSRNFPARDGLDGIVVPGKIARGKPLGGEHGV